MVGRTVGAMDGAIEPHGWVYGVSCPPTPPRHPTDSPLLLLLSLLPLPLQVQGCRPCRTPQMSVGASPYCSAKRLLKLATDR